MESTGVYWIPVWNILERGNPKLNLLLVNPAPVKALQGNKTDRVDARPVSAVRIAAEKFYSAETDAGTQRTEAHAGSYPTGS